MCFAIGALHEHLLCTVLQNLAVDEALRLLQVNQQLRNYVLFHGAWGGGVELFELLVQDHEVHGNRILATKAYVCVTTKSNVEWVFCPGLLMRMAWIPHPEGQGRQQLIVAQYSLSSDDFSGLIASIRRCRDFRVMLSERWVTYKIERFLKSAPSTYSPRQSLRLQLDKFYPRARCLRDLKIVAERVDSMRALLGSRLAVKLVTRDANFCFPPSDPPEEQPDYSQLAGILHDHPLMRAVSSRVAFVYFPALSSEFLSEHTGLLAVSERVPRLSEMLDKIQDLLENSTTMRPASSSSQMIILVTHQEFPRAGREEATTRQPPSQELTFEDLNACIWRQNNAMPLKTDHPLAIGHFRRFFEPAWGEEHLYRFHQDAGDQWSSPLGYAYAALDFTQRAFYTINVAGKQDYLLMIGHYSSYAPAIGYTFTMEYLDRSTNKP